MRMKMGKIEPYEDPKLLKKIEQNENDYAARLEIGKKIKDRLAWDDSLSFSFEEYNGCFNKGLEHLSKIPENSQEFLEAQFILGAIFAGKLSLIESDIVKWDFKYGPEDQSNDFRQALIYLQKIPKHNSFYYEALFSMGTLYYHDKQYEEGIEYFKKIPVKNPIYWDAQHHILLGLFSQASTTKKNKDLDKLKQQYDKLLNPDKIAKDMMYLMLVLTSPIYQFKKEHSLYVYIEKKLQKSCLIFSKNIRKKMLLLLN